MRCYCRVVYDATPNVSEDSAVTTLSSTIAAARDSHSGSFFGTSTSHSIVALSRHIDVYLRRGGCGTGIGERQLLKDYRLLKNRFLEEGRIFIEDRLFRE